MHTSNSASQVSKQIVPSQHMTFDCIVLDLRGDGVPDCQCPHFEWCENDHFYFPGSPPSQGSAVQHFRSNILLSTEGFCLVGNTGNMFHKCFILKVGLLGSKNRNTSQVKKLIQSN